MAVAELSAVLEGKVMTVYFQHVGQQGAARDFPRTIGTTDQGLKKIYWADVESYLRNLSDDERRNLEQRLSLSAPDGFQIWGIPSGARTVLRELRNGDFLLLLEDATPGGRFGYIGRVVAFPTIECHDLSQHLWQQSKYSIIVFLIGGLTAYPFAKFCDSFGYSLNWNPRGMTYALRRLNRSQYVSEAQFIREVLGFYPDLNTERPAIDDSLVVLSELDISDEEGRRQLRSHIHRERSARLITEFKKRLTNYSCSVCGFNFERVYGTLGVSFIEAHHTKPVSQLEEGERVSLDDLAPVCSNCHSMLHRRFPPVSCKQLTDIIVDHVEH
jgi:5-methylcytosine-specific restriction protein A